jgi:exonuclease SbcC
LSDSIQQRAAANQHFFFLDEGFGSLDKESWTSSSRPSNRCARKTASWVSSPTSRNAAGNRTHLRITNDDERGSLISTSSDTSFSKNRHCLL